MNIPEESLLEGISLNSMQDFLSQRTTNIIMIEQRKTEYSKISSLIKIIINVEEIIGMISEYSKSSSMSIYDEKLINGINKLSFYFEQDKDNLLSIKLTNLSEDNKQKVLNALCEIGKEDPWTSDNWKINGEDWYDYFI